MEQSGVPATSSTTSESTAVTTVSRQSDGLLTALWWFVAISATLIVGFLACGGANVIVGGFGG